MVAHRPTVLGHRTAHRWDLSWPHTVRRRTRPATTTKGQARTMWSSNPRHGREHYAQWNSAPSRVSIGVAMRTHDVHRRS